MRLLRRRGWGQGGPKGSSAVLSSGLTPWTWSCTCSSPDLGDLAPPSAAHTTSQHGHCNSTTAFFTCLTCCNARFALPSCRLGGRYIPNMHNVLQGRCIKIPFLHTSVRSVTRVICVHPITVSHHLSSLCGIAQC